MRLHFLCLAVALGFSLPAVAQESPLVSLETSDSGQGWQAVGRLNLGGRGFCTGTLILAGWRNGRAEAYRGAARTIAHPDYIYAGAEDLDRVAFDVALVQLDQPILLPQITPFVTDQRPRTGDEVGVVSYAQDRAEAPSLQQTCHVLDRAPEILVLSCNVDFGSSGAPIFALRGGELRIVSVVSAKAELDGQHVALGTSLTGPLQVLRAELSKQAGGTRLGRPKVRLLSGGQAAGAKFIQP
jgi:hypothetical protein